MHAALPRLRRYSTLLDDFRVADLLVEREDLLIEELRCLGVMSPRHRFRIRAELAQIRDELERLGFAGEPSR